MAAGIVYLDVDDEITSAAARIRSSASTKIALVVPYGSRIATSRMNFRLLSREAVVSNRRLSIVSGDAAARSLAASAGLPVYATVGEYETAIAGGSTGVVAPPTDGGADDDGHPAATTLAESATVAAIGGAATSAAGATGTGQPSAAPAPPTEETARMSVPAAAAAAATATAAPVAAPRPTPRPIPAPTDTAERAEGGRRVRTPLLVVAALGALALIVLAVGAYLLLPSATIAVTPKREPISVNLTVSADPAATAIDPSTATIPAVKVDIPVQVSQTFKTTGVHVDEQKATGTVTFTSENTFIEVTVSRGTRVSTTSGVAFVTTTQVVIPKASFATGPSNRSVGVEAIRPGTSGNVEAGTITQEPSSLRALLVSVNNQDPTSGGTRTETPQVTKSEVDKAVAGLQTQLEAQFHDSVAAGDGAPAGSTVFPETATLGDSTPSPDPKTLVGQAVSSYDLSLSASGSVIAVDSTPVRQIAEGQLTAKVGSDHRLVDGSTQVDVGVGTVGEDGSVSFPAHATAERVLILDANRLLALVKGKTKAEALAALAPFGSATVSLWPDWVTTVTAIDGRLDLTIDESAAPQGPGASGAPPGSPVASGTAAPRASGSVRGNPSARPAASGEPAASGDAGSAAP